MEAFPNQNSPATAAAAMLRKPQPPRQQPNQKTHWTKHRKRQCQPHQRRIAAAAAVARNQIAMAIKRLLFRQSVNILSPEIFLFGFVILIRTDIRIVLDYPKEFSRYDKSK